MGIINVSLDGELFLRPAFFFAPLTDAFSDVPNKLIFWLHARNCLVDKGFSPRDKSPATRLNVSPVAPWRVYNLPGIVGNGRQITRRAVMKGKRILVVDDTPVTRQGTALIVTCFGYEVGEAGDGEAALLRLSTGDYGAVLMDYNMPRMNGLECTAKIRELEKGTGKRIPIIGISASQESEVVSQIMRTLEFSAKTSDT